MKIIKYPGISLLRNTRILSPVNVVWLKSADYRAV